MDDVGRVPVCKDTDTPSAPGVGEIHRRTREKKEEGGRRNSDPFREYNRKCCNNTIMIMFLKKALTVAKVFIAAYRGRPLDTLRLADTLVDEGEREKRIATYPFCVHTEEKGQLASSYFREEAPALEKMHRALGNSRCAWTRKRS